MKRFACVLAVAATSLLASGPFSDVLSLRHDLGEVGSPIRVMVDTDGFRMEATTLIFQRRGLDGEWREPQRVVFVQKGSLWMATIDNLPLEGPSGTTLDSDTTFLKYWLRREDSSGQVHESLPVVADLALREELWTLRAQVQSAQSMREELDRKWRDEAERIGRGCEDDKLEAVGLLTECDVQLSRLQEELQRCGKIDQPFIQQQIRGSLTFDWRLERIEEGIVARISSDQLLGFRVSARFSSSANGDGDGTVTRKTSEDARSHAVFVPLAQEEYIVEIEPLINGKSALDLARELTDDQVRQTEEILIKKVLERQRREGVRPALDRDDPRVAATRGKLTSSSVTFEVEPDREAIVELTLIEIQEDGKKMKVGSPVGSLPRFAYDRNGVNGRPINDIVDFWRPESRRVSFDDLKPDTEYELVYSVADSEGRYRNGARADFFRTPEKRPRLAIVGPVSLEIHFNKLDLTWQTNREFKTGYVELKGRQGGASFTQKEPATWDQGVASATIVPEKGWSDLAFDEPPEIVISVENPSENDTVQVRLRMNLVLPGRNALGSSHGLDKATVKALTSLWEAKQSPNKEKKITWRGVANLGLTLFTKFVKPVP